MSTPTPITVPQPDPATVVPPGEPTPPTPPAPPSPNGPAPADADAGTPEARLARAEAALAAERSRAKALEKDLDKAKQASMTDAEKQLAKARDDGRAEARRDAGLAVAGAEFRAAATGRLADPAATLDALDLSKFVGDDGEVDSAGIAALVEKLTAALPAPGTPKIPAGPHGAPASDDFLGAGIRQGGGFR